MTLADQLLAEIFFFFPFGLSWFFTSGTVGFSHKSDQSEPPSSNDPNVINSTRKLKSPCARSQSDNSLFGCGNSKNSGENVNCQLQEEPVAECNMGHVESLLVGPFRRKCKLSASDGGGDVKKESSFLSCPPVIPSFRGMCTSEEQKQCQVGTEKDTTASSSRAFGESRGRAAYFSMMACLRSGSNRLLYVKMGCMKFFKTMVPVLEWCNNEMIIYEYVNFHWHLNVGTE